MVKVSRNLLRPAGPLVSFKPFQPPPPPPIKRYNDEFRFQNRKPRSPKPSTPPDPNRKRPDWKRYLFQLYTVLFEPKRYPISVFLNSERITHGEWQKLRNQLPENSKMTFLRSGLLPPVFSSMDSLEPFPQGASKGTLMLVSFKEIDPPKMRKFFKALDRFNRIVLSDPNLKSDPNSVGKFIRLRMGYVNGKYLDANAFAEFSKLPGLDECRGQIVGLVNAIPQRLVGTIGAKNDELYRTLQGRQLAMEEQEKGPNLST